MEIKAKLIKPYSETERINFIVEQNHKNGYEIKETEIALEAWGYSDEEKTEQEQERINNLMVTQQEFWNFILPLEKEAVEEKLKAIPELHKKILIELNNPDYKYGSISVQAIKAIYDLDFTELFSIPI